MVTKEWNRFSISIDVIEPVTSKKEDMIMSAIEKDQDIQFGTLYIDSMYK